MGLPEDLAVALRTDRSGELRTIWAKRIASGRNLGDFIVLLDEGHPVGMRFMWLMGEVCELAPDLVRGFLPALFLRKDDFTFPGFHRSLARWMSIAGVPEELEGEVLEVFVGWILAPEEDIATKSYAIKVLLGMAGRYPEIVPELRLVLKGQLEMHTAAYQRRIRNVLAAL